MKSIEKIKLNILSTKTLILFLIVIIFLFNYQKTEASSIIKDASTFGTITIFTPEEVSAQAAIKTKTLTGVSYDNGIKISYDTEFGKVYGDMPNGDSATKLKEALTSLYNNVMPLEQQQWDAINERNKISGTQAGIDSSAHKELDLKISNLEGQIQTAIVNFKKSVNWDTTYDTARVAAANKESQALQGQIIYCWGGINVGFSLPGCIAIFSYFVLYLTSWILLVAASLFDYTIGYSLSMTDIVNSFSAIQYTWEVFRNLINLFFILILIFISISTILQVDAYGQKKLLGKLVLAAILINFSMFFTKVIIDVSNITALVFYKQIMLNADKKAGGVAAGDNAVSKTAVAAQSGASDMTNNHLALGIMNALGMQTVWGVAKNSKSGSTEAGATNVAKGSAGNNPATNPSNTPAGTTGSAPVVLNPWNMILVGFGGSVFILILSFVFLAAAFMFLIRTAVLIILLMTSPIAFAANVLPQTSKLSASWWKRLTSAVLFAPVYMILMFITLKMLWGRSDNITNLLSMFSDNGAPGWTAGLNSVFFFFLLCMMLGMTLTSAASIGAMGSTTMQKWGKDLSTGAKKRAKNFAINRTTAVPSRLADMASRSTLLGKMATSDSAIGRFIGSRTLQGADAMAKSKLGGSSSYRDRVKEKEKGIEARAKLAEANIKKRPGESDIEYYNRTGYRDGDLKKTKNETNANYEARMSRLGFNLTMDGYKDDDGMKADVSKAYGVNTDSSGKTSLKDLYVSRGSKAAAMSRIEDLGKKAKEKKNSASEQLDRLKSQLYRPADTIIDTATGRTLGTPDGELLNLVNYLRAAAPGPIANRAHNIFNSTNKDNIGDKALEMKTLLEGHRSTLISNRTVIKSEAEDARQAAIDAVSAPGATAESKQDAHNAFVIKTAALTELQADIDEFDKTKSGLASHLSKMDELNIAQSQLEAASRPATPPAGTP